MPAFAKPRTTRRGRNLQLSYDLPNDLHTAKVYPIRAPNGSTILLYGHESGLKIIWRGGKALKVPKAAEVPKPKANGTNNDSLMIIDSDDEDTSAQKPGQSHPPPAEFEDEDEEFDIDEPYASIVQTLDIPLGTEVLHIAVPDTLPSASQASRNEAPALYEKKIVVVAAGVDDKVRLVTLPLTPPSDIAKEQQSNSSNAPKLFDNLDICTHLSIPNGVALTHTLATDGKTWHILIASTVVGTVSLSKIATKDAEMLPKTLTLAKTLHLGPNRPVSIAFNTISPAERSQQLLIAEKGGLVRIYDPSAPSRSRHRGASNSDQTGAWIATLETSWEMPKNVDPSAQGLAQRKRILAAKWVLDGNAILALLADGEWGIWNIGAPELATVRRSAPTAFAIRGYLDSSSRSNDLSSSSRQGWGNLSSLAPMTPNTRKSKSGSLFQGAITPTRSTVRRGGLSVFHHPPTSDGRSVESVLIWYNNEVYRISNLQQSIARSLSSSKGNSLSGIPIARLDDVNLHGEMINDIDQFPLLTPHNTGVTTPDTLIAAQSRLLILSNNAPTPQSNSSLTLALRTSAAQDDSMVIDQGLLSRGELDLGGMDRLMDSMTDATSNGVGALTRTVGFAS